MFLEAVRSEGLSHLSFVTGGGGRAAVIDPRRDCSVYLDLARRSGARITHIFETHRNEDHLTGSKELSLLTAAPVYHGGKTAFRFGNPVFDGDTFDVGGIRLSILETPGHTPESISIVLADMRRPHDPIAVFSGDALLVGGTGRVDLFPGRQREYAGLLYESIFTRLLPLGDHVILYPSHGGSAGEEGYSERVFSTLGFERRNNPALRFTSRDAFVAHKIRERQFIPPYFSLMLRQNLEGPPIMNGLPQPQPYTADDFMAAMALGMFAVDTRSPASVCGTYIPGSLAIPLDRLIPFAGWFIPYDCQIGLIVGEDGHAATAVRSLVRVGFESVQAYLVSDAHAWETGSGACGSIPTVRIPEIRLRKQKREQFTLIDVRTEDEYDSGRLDDAVNMFIGEIPVRLDEIPRDRPVIVYCGNGTRSIIAASFLRMHGIEQIEIGLGSPEARPDLRYEMVTGVTSP